MTELIEALESLEEDKINLVRHGDEIISDEALNTLLDRSPEAMTRERGWNEASQIGKVMELEKEEPDDAFATRIND